MTIEWKVEAKRGDEVTVWKVVLDGLSLSIHRIHGIEGWYLSSYVFHIRDQELIAQDGETAKIEGIQIFRRALETRIVKYQKILKALEEQS